MSNIIDEISLMVCGKSVSLFLLSSYCDWYGSEYNVNYSIEDSHCKDLFISCDDYSKAKSWFDYISLHYNDLYIETRNYNYGKIKGVALELRLKNLDQAKNNINKNYNNIK